MTTLVMITACRPGWEESLAKWNGPKVIVFHGDIAEDVPGAVNLWYQGTFNFGAMVNLAMQDVDTLGAWVQHDDAVLADPDAMKIAEAQARAHKAVMVLPYVDGPDASWQQRIEGLGCSDAVAPFRWDGPPRARGAGVCPGSSLSARAGLWAWRDCQQA